MAAAQGTKGLRIGEVARRAGVAVETVRFYERQGLLEEPQRTRSGYREYGEETIARLQFIRRAKGLGFTLKEIRALLSLQLDPSRPAAEVKRHAEAKIAAIDAKIRSLEEMKRTLVALSQSCCAHGTAADCRLLQALADGPDPCDQS